MQLHDTVFYAIFEKRRNGEKSKMEKFEFLYFIYDKTEMDRILEKEQIKNLFADLRQHGVGLKEWNTDQKFSQDWNKSLFLTTMREKAEQISSYGAAVVGYEVPGSAGAFWHDVDMVLQGLDEVDYEFLNRVYLRKHGLPWNILTTQRCVVREMTVQDLDALYTLYEDPMTKQYMEPLYPPQKEFEYVKSYIQNRYRYFGYGMWLIVQKESGRVIGRAGFDEVEVNGRVETEFGYLIAADLRRQGYAKEVCTALLQYGKQYHAFEEVTCRIAVSNIPSITLAESLGFVYEQELWQENKQLRQYRIRL